MKVQHFTYLQIVLFSSFFVNSLHCVANGDQKYSENSPEPRALSGTPMSFVPYYNSNPTNSYIEPSSNRETIAKKSPSNERKSDDLHYDPCSFVPSRTSGLQRWKNFSLTRGLYECENICQILYGGLKFAVCLPVLDCRCLTKGLFQFKNWWRDVKEDPTTTPLAIGYQVSKASMRRRR